VTTTLRGKVSTSRHREDKGEQDKHWPSWLLQAVLVFDTFSLTEENQGLVCKGGRGREERTWLNQLSWPRRFKPVASSKRQPYMSRNRA
jgi:hypothetical protein